MRRFFSISFEHRPCNGARQKVDILETGVAFLYKRAMRTILCRKLLRQILCTV